MDLTFGLSSGLHQFSLPVYFFIDLVELLITVEVDP